jgi:hypothetical protein
VEVLGGSGGMEKADAEVPAVGEVDLEAGRIEESRRVRLRSFGDQGEIGDEFAARLKSPAMVTCLSSGRVFSSVFFACSSRAAARCRCSRPSPPFAIARFCRILVCSAAPRPFAFLMRSSLAAASSSASDPMPRSLWSRSTLSGRRPQPKLLETGMGAGLVQLGDDVGDGLADAGPPRSAGRAARRGLQGYLPRESRPWSDTDCRRATPCAARTPGAAWRRSAYRPSTHEPSGLVSISPPSRGGRP